MNLINWRKTPPLSIRRTYPFQDLRSELEKVISDFYNPLDTARVAKDTLENLSLVPATDIVDEKDSFKVETEMPGIAEENVKVAIDGSTLTIRAEKNKSRKNKDKNYLRREICYGSYEVSIDLPESVDTSTAKASFKKGMLWVVFSKKSNSSKSYRELKVEKAES